MARVFIPGSFDPLHLGHLDVICTAQRLFGEVVVGVLYNREKSLGLFSPDERVALIGAAVAAADSGPADASQVDASRVGASQVEARRVDASQVEVVSSDRLAVQAARDAGADFIVKGLRTAADFEIEQQMAHTNHAVAGIQTVFVPCHPDHSFISSRFVREIAAQGGDITALVNAPIALALSDKFSNG